MAVFCRTKFSFVYYTNGTLASVSFPLVQNTSPSSAVECIICRFVASEILKEIRQGVPVHEEEDRLRERCKNLLVPSLVNQCVALIDTKFSSLYQAALESNNNARRACFTVGFCGTAVF